MSNTPNYLKVFRRRSPLMLEDIAFLLNLTDYSNISRYEKGQRTPTLELLLAYHFLFDTTIESFFELESRIIKQSFIERVKELLAELKKEEQITLKNTTKIKFLEQVITRLIN
jgi:transcriptional regulator with XRE-family HTH domain